MDIVEVKLSDIEEAPFNYNLHPQNQIDELRGSLEEFGQFKNIVLWKGYCIAGNGLTFAARSMGLESLRAIIRDDLTEEQAKRLCVADNATPYLAQPDRQKLEELLKSLPSCNDIPGVNEDWLNTLDLSFDTLVDTPEADIDDSTDDEVPEVEEAITKVGDLWQLGNHCLLCGDNTSQENIQKLVVGGRVAMVFTDPPYGMNLDTNFSSITKAAIRKAKRTGVDKRIHHTGKDYNKVIGDDQDFDPAFIFEAFPKVKEMFLWGADYFAERIPRKNKGSWFVWDKRAEGLEHVEFSLSEFETCWSKNKHARKILRYQWFGACGLQFEKDEAQGSKPLARVHPNQKPVRMIKWFLQQYGNTGDIVVDLFGGSGSTLIACEVENMECRMVELDPIYCTTIIKRWEQYTGKQAVLLDA